MWLMALVFVSDAFIDYLGGRYFDSRALGNKRKSFVYGNLFNFAVGINILGFAEQKWVMLIPSLLGGAVGLALSLWD